MLKLSKYILFDILSYSFDFPTAVACLRQLNKKTNKLLADNHNIMREIFPDYSIKLQQNIVAIDFEQNVFYILPSPESSNSEGFTEYVMNTVTYDALFGYRLIFPISSNTHTTLRQVTFGENHRKSCHYIWDITLPLNIRSYINSVVFYPKNKNI
jgi:hypothetical protein